MFPVRSVSWIYGFWRQNERKQEWNVHGFGERNLDVLIKIGGVVSISRQAKQQE